MTTVLGCDPSLAAFGWALVRLDASPVVLAAGCIRVKLEKSRGPKTAASARRLASIARELLRVFETHQPDRVVAELPMGGRHAGTAKALAQSFAVTVTCCEVAGRPATFVTPRAAKRAATGSPAASKAEVAAGVYARTGWRSTARSRAAREAEADAVAVALTVEGGT